MSPRAGPAVRPGVPADLGSDRILLNVAQGSEVVLSIQRTGEIPVLPQMAAPAVHAVNVLCVDKIAATYGLGQRIVLERCGDKVDMVCHQTISVDSHAKLLRLLFQ